jgi:hypothetical protein
MSLTYLERRAVVERVLSAEDVRPSKNSTVSDLAGKVLEALDQIKENVR